MPQTPPSQRCIVLSREEKLKHHFVFTAVKVWTFSDLHGEPIADSRIPILLEMALLARAVTGDRPTRTLTLAESPRKYLSQQFGRKMLGINRSVPGQDIFRISDLCYLLKSSKKLPGLEASPNILKNQKKSTILTSLRRYAAFWRVENRKSGTKS